METIVILLVAAGLSAWVVWWAIVPEGGRPGRKPDPRRRSGSGRRGSVPRMEEEPEPLGEILDRPGSRNPAVIVVQGRERRPEGFVLLPSDEPVLQDDRPPPALSILRLALTIAFVAAVAVAVVTLLGFLVKAQLDQYFTGR